ncbi:MAG: phenylalanine--tRNA ligase subunit beta [Candidatus Pacebacteria bacterium]|nr:phenylalanine--tRNA ligase subunit beta [Candidatus Paceibacterota bacterium]
MKVSYNWLKTLLKLNTTPEKLADILTMNFAETTVKSLGKRPVLDVELGSNQVAWASGHLSLAREIGACLGKKFVLPEPKIKENKTLAKNLLTLDIQTSNCKYYSARILQGVKVKESPQWLKERLSDCGIRPINNLVDAANYVMLETGQPLHVFDFDKLNSEQKTIIVRQAKNKEKINALDGQNYILNKEMMVIADKKQPIALAGIKGGQETGVNKATKNIILESANFVGNNIHLTSKNLGLKTDASWRFEHNIPFELTVYALDRLAELIQQVAGGDILKGSVKKVKDISGWKQEKIEIPIKWENWEKFLGWPINKKKIIKNLSLLGFSLKEKKEYLLVTPPQFRNDLKIKEDVMGEVARLEGINRIVSVLPREQLKLPTKNEFWVFREKIKDWLKGCGLEEIYNYSFLSEKDKKSLPIQWQEKMIEIENPTSALTKYLRPTFLVNFLKNINYNFRFTDTIRFFEIGKVYSLKEESFVFGGVLAQKIKSNNQLFFQAKGILEGLMDSFGIGSHDYILKPLSKTRFSDLLKQGVAIYKEEDLIGVLGQPQDFLKKDYDCEGEIIYWEIGLSSLFNFINEEREFQSLPKYPAVIRDISFMIPQNILIDQVLRIIQGASPSYLEEVDLFDIYVGKNLPQGNKSLSFHLIFRSQKHTLENKEVDKEIEKIYKALKILGAKIR